MARPHRDARATVVRWRELCRGDAAPGTPHRRIAVAASFTAQPIAPGLGVGLHDVTGVIAELRFADYNQLFQVCLDPASAGIGDADDVVLLWRIEDVFERDLHAWGNGAEGALAALLAGAGALGGAVAQLAATATASVVVSDAPVPIGFGLDHDDPELLTRLADLQRQVNAAFDAGLGEARVDRLRLAALQLAAGTRASFDRRGWLMYRQPYPEAFAQRVGSAVADVIAGRTRVPPKVVVLDCDDTLWGGVAADDGIGALQCGDAFPGLAYRSFQIALQRLRHQGVMLAIASKNDPETVVRAFAEVDGMVLGDGDLAARRVSWGPKAPAVAEIAAELNIGLDAVVFVDDSAHEIGAMQVQLPDVRTLQVPEELERLPDLLAETGWFRLMRVTGDDRERTARMLAEAGRAQAATTMTQAEFLASLGLEVRVIEVGASELGRVTQLVNKTNQFNLTTIRRPEGEIAALVADPGTVVLAFAVRDRFGEYGIVAVTIARRAGDEWDLDTVLMSCRVLGRGVETAVLAATVERARARHPGAVRGHYRATDRNAMVAGLLADHGFDPLGGGDLVLPADRTIAAPGHVTVVT